MNERVVCDASALVALLIDAGPDGAWAADQLADSSIAAPHLAPFEVANVLRRQELAGAISTDTAQQAHADLIDLGIELWPYELFAPRGWALRHNLSLYDASYVALAELTDSVLVSLDGRLARAPGIACEVATPGG